MSASPDFSGGALCVGFLSTLWVVVANGVPGSSGGFEHFGVGASHEVGVEGECDAGVAQVVALFFVPGDAHDKCAGYAGGFLQGAKCAAGGVGG